MTKAVVTAAGGLLTLTSCSAAEDATGANDADIPRIATMVGASALGHALADWERKGVAANA